MSLEDRLREVLQSAERHPAPDFADRVLAALPAHRALVLWSGRLLAAPLAVASVAAVLVTALLIGPALAPGIATPPAASTTAAPTPSGSVATYPDGIPREIEGQPVLRGGAITRYVEAASSDEPFFIAGWATGPISWRCPPPLIDRPPNPLLPCGGGGVGIHLMDAPDQPNGLVVMSTIERNLPAPGPVVLRVHVYDKGAALCPTELRALCERTLVLSEVAWTRAGDSGLVIRPVAGDSGVARQAAIDRLQVMANGEADCVLMAQVDREDPGPEMDRAVAELGGREGRVSVSPPAWRGDHTESAIGFGAEELIVASEDEIVLYFIKRTSSTDWYDVQFPGRNEPAVDSVLAIEMHRHTLADGSFVWYLPGSYFRVAPCSR